MGRLRPKTWLYSKVVLLVVAVTWIVAACGGGGERPSSFPSQRAATPVPARYTGYTSPTSHKAQGKLVFADKQFPDTVNPLFASSTVDFEVEAALWAGPVFYDQQFHIHPDQLTEVPLPENDGVRDGGKTIIMHLRHDLRWSDGQPILASDFEYWWHLDQDENTGALITTGYDQIASIDVPDNFTVVLHMKRAFGPYLLSLPYAAPQHVWGKWRDIELQNQTSVYQVPQVTDGPYMLSSFVDGQSYTLVPDPYYTSTTFHGPFVSQLVFQAYNDVAALSAAVRGGEVDVAEGYMEDELPYLRHLPPGVLMLEPLAAAYEHLDFNMSHTIFQDMRVRQAIQLAINKCGLMKEVLGTPDCSRQATQVEPLPSLVYDASIQGSLYDPRAARKLLTQAGWLPDSQGVLNKNGQSFVIYLVTTAGNPLRMAAAERIRRDLLTVGIEVKVESYALGDFFGVYTKGGILATGAYDLAMFGYSNSPDPDDEYGVFHSSQIPSAEQPDAGNYGRVTDAVIDEALTAGRYTVVWDARVKFYHRFLERLAEEVYVIPLYVGVNVLTVSSRVQNVLPNANAVANNWNVSDWWVSG